MISWRFVFGADPTVYTAEELIEIADKIYSNQLTSETTQNLFNSMAETEKVIITSRLAEHSGVQMDDLKQEKERFRNQGVVVQAASPGYDVQMPHTSNLGSPNVDINSYWSTMTCDSDPSDWNFVFFANTPQTVHPSSMRWHSTVPLVTWALNYAYGGALSTYGSHLYQINICLGTGGVNLGGGPNTVRDAFVIQYQ